jgi:DNA replication and repair protein RecF
MFCTHISLTNFRNYVRLDLDFTSETAIILGDNAQGKSNLLEAIYLLATTKSFRAGSDRELINWNAGGGDLPYARVSARVQRAQSASKLDIVISEEQRRAGSNGSANGTSTSVMAKRFKVNNAAHRALDIIGLVNVVLFTPQDIDLVLGAPAVRRRYLDITISQIDSRYVRSLAHYQRVLAQRNHLLRQIRDRHASIDELEFWNQELVNVGSYLLAKRCEVVSRLGVLGLGTHRDLAGGQELLGVTYRSTVPDIAAEGQTEAPTVGDLATVVDAFRSQLAKQSEREVAYGMSLVGPHRDDLVLQLNGREASVYGSRGQQRTAILAIKLAEAILMHERTGEHPIILLDDVMSELDERRRAHVLEAVRSEQQVFLTATDLASLGPVARRSADVWSVEAGALSRQSSASGALG